MASEIKPVLIDGARQPGLRRSLLIYHEATKCVSVLSAFTCLETMCPNIWAKSLPKNAICPLLVRHRSLGQPHALRVEGFGELSLWYKVTKITWALTGMVPVAHPHKSNLTNPTPPPPPPHLGLICAWRQCEGLSITLGKFAISGEFHAQFRCEWFPCKNRKVEQSFTLYFIFFFHKNTNSSFSPLHVFRTPC